MIVAGQSMATRGIELGIALFFIVVSAATAAALPTIALNGHAQYETFGYPDAGTRGQRWENFFEAELRSHGQLSPALSYEAEGRVVADDAEYTAGAYSLRNDNIRRPYLSLLTAVIDYRPLPELRVSIGKQIVNWDSFDGVQPANLLSNLDQSDPFRPVAQGVDGISIHYQPGAAYLDLTVVPMAFTPSRSPQHRWIIVPSVTPLRPDLPPVRFDETQAGTRLGGRWGDLEASMFGYVGRDSLPLFVLDFSRLVIRSRSARLRAGGMNASYPLGERLLLRVEEVYLSSPDRDRGDFLNSLAGGEYTLGDWRLVLGYLRQDMTARAPQKVLSQGERVFFQSFISGELRYDAGGPWQARLRGGYDVRGDFVLVEPEVSYPLWQALRLALVGNYIDAHRKNDYFYRIRNEDRVGLRLEYQF
jgi:hypothetical protein